MPEYLSGCLAGELVNAFQYGSCNEFVPSKKSHNNIRWDQTINEMLDCNKFQRRAVKWKQLEPAHICNYIELVLEKVVP